MSWYFPPNEEIKEIELNDSLLSDNVNTSTECESIDALNSSIEQDEFNIKCCCDEIDLLNSVHGNNNKSEVISASELGLNVNAPDFSYKSNCYDKYNHHTFSEEFSNNFHCSKTTSFSKLNTNSNFIPLSSRVEIIDEEVESDWSDLSYRDTCKKLPNYKEDEFNTDDILSHHNNLQLPNSDQWPSLQIICPDQSMFMMETFNDLKLKESPRSKLPNALHTTVGSPINNINNRGTSCASSPRVSYFPMSSNTHLDEMMPISYHKLGMNYAYSPTQRSANPNYDLNTIHNRSTMQLPNNYRGSPVMTPISVSSMSMLGSGNLRSPLNRIDRRFMEPIDGHIYQVQFKRAHKNYILAPSAPLNIIPGDFVKVEADRGEDMGIVLSKSLASDFEEVIPTAGYRGRGFSSGQGERKFLFRLATSEERAALAIKVIDEERALETIRTKVLEQMLPMSILDAEYQFDRHKLTFFFEADRRIDFRELVSELFSLYKTRIWMQQVDTTVLGQHDPGTELAKATGFLPERDDYAYYQHSQLYRTLETQNQFSTIPSLQFPSVHSSSLLTTNVNVNPISSNNSLLGTGYNPVYGTNLDSSLSTPSTPRKHHTNIPQNLTSSSYMNNALYHTEEDYFGENLFNTNNDPITSSNAIESQLLDASWNFRQM